MKSKKGDLIIVREQRSKRLTDQNLIVTNAAQLPKTPGNFIIEGVDLKIEPAK